MILAPRPGASADRRDPALLRAALSFLATGGHLLFLPLFFILALGGLLGGRWRMADGIGVHIETDLLPIYLNDHLAGSTAGLELARRLLRSNSRNEYGPSLARLAGEIEQDRKSLQSIMSALDVEPDRVKLVLGWAAEKVGRLKLNGRLLSYSPLSRLMELEILMLGVTGKLALWRTLRQLAVQDPRLDRNDLDRLIERAAGQQQEIEELRERAVTDAFGPAAG